MLLSTKAVRGLIVSVLILALAGLAVADTIRLKDGSILKGKIVAFGGGKFVVAIGDGSRKRELTFISDEVESISFDDSQAAVTNRNAAYKEPVIKDEPVSPPRVVIGGNPAPKQPSGEKMKPIEWQIKVTADSTANGWTNTGWVVKKGQRIRITGSGKVSLGKNQSSPPSGVASIDDSQKLLKNVATGALIAVIGDDNNDFIYVGATREFTATRDGALFLGINEGNLDDNSGTFDVKIEIIPDTGE
ncbi:MAG: LecA/PA-IL family lectin [Pyrinomonadaceae bacterium]